MLFGCVQISDSQSPTLRLKKDQRLKILIIVGKVHNFSSNLFVLTLWTDESYYYFSILFLSLIWGNKLNFSRLMCIYNEQEWYLVVGNCVIFYVCFLNLHLSCHLIWLGCDEHWQAIFLHGEWRSPPTHKNFLYFLRRE